MLGTLLHIQSAGTYPVAVAAARTAGAAVMNLHLHFAERALGLNNRSDASLRLAGQQTAHDGLGSLKRRRI